MSQQDFTEDYAGTDFQENGNSSVMEPEVTAAKPSVDSQGGITSVCEDNRKMFVGGLSWETTEKDLRDYFSPYGEIESISVKTDPNTGRSKGFAFIVFNLSETIDKITEVTEHAISGKKVDPKRAKARHGKIFVGGLKPELTDEEIKTFFESFGSIVEMEMPFDKTLNQRKGFCFITFQKENVVNDLLKNPKQTINGHQVDVRKATPKPDQMGRGGMRGSGRGRGRGWGNQGYNQGGYGGHSDYDYGNYGYGGYGNNGGGQGYGGGDKSYRGGRQQMRYQPY